MSIKDLARIDSLIFELKAHGNPLATGDHGLDGFLEPLEAYAGELMPSTVKSDKGRRRKYSRAAVYKGLEEARKSEGATSLYFEHPPSPEVWLSLGVNLEKTPCKVSILLQAIPLSLLQEPAHAEERSRKLIDLARAWAQWCPPTYASAHSMADAEISGDPNNSLDWEVLKNATHDKIYAVYWLNIFGKALVEQVGRERVLSTPGHLVEELPSGCVLLVTRPTIADITSEESRLAQARALVHLRPELSFDEVMAQMRERNATLAPVEPRFDPDAAELLWQLADHVPISQRQRKIAELNAWRPPEISEWLPLASAPGSDVENPSAEIIRYQNLLAEQLAAQLHTEVPSVMHSSPESLAPIDYHLWLMDYPGFEREDVEQLLVPAVGAYLGDVMVRHLGGQWVPRRNLDETQVRVGGRAWLPFLRARHYLKTQQSILDCSLTQFYRAAERHLRSLQRS